MRQMNGSFRERTSPLFMDDARAINKKLCQLSKKKLAALMKMSPKLAEENAERNQQWGKPDSQKSSTPALLTYDGESYRSLTADDFSAAEMEFAQKHLRVLSGLYGVLRPLDSILPYRLEMQAALPVKRTRNLYEFWSQKITQTLANHLNDTGVANPVLINLASGEYFKTVKVKELGFPVLTLNFKEEKDGKFRTVSVFSKQARGMMARYMIKKGITDCNELQSFKEAGYSFNKNLSTDSEWIFSRKPQK
ncbi:MAG: peroxide stress protein YaaA [bacterium]|nr:peroxide stress protein YaaA [bacterium]